jgi:hypothetical protein
MLNFGTCAEHAVADASSLSKQHATQCEFFDADLEMTMEIVEAGPISCDELLALKIFDAVTAGLTMRSPSLCSSSV